MERYGPSGGILNHILLLTKTYQRVLVVYDMWSGLFSLLVLVAYYGLTVTYLQNDTQQFKLSLYAYKHGNFCSI